MSVISPSDYRIKDFVTNFTQEPLVKKYLYRGVWVSGCQTTVHPITIDRNSIRIQWNCDKKIFQKFINRIVEKIPTFFPTVYSGNPTAHVRRPSHSISERCDNYEQIHLFIRNMPLLQMHGFRMCSCKYRSSQPLLRRPL